MTNADKIRAMTDEELVSFVMAPCMKWGEPCEKPSCWECILDWLKQEVEE